MQYVLLRNGLPLSRGGDFCGFFEKIAKAFHTLSDYTP